MRKKLSHLVNTYLTDKLPYTFHATGETRPITNHIDCNSKNVIYMIQCNDCSKQCRGETKRRHKESFNEHSRSVDNPSTIFLLMITLLTTSHLLQNLVETVQEKLEKHTSSREVKLLNHQVWIQSLFLLFVIIYLLFFHFKFLSNHCFNGFCFQLSLFSHFNFHVLF